MSNFENQSRLRALVKSITWRVVAVIITTLVTLAITGEIETAATVGGIDAVIKFVGYYLHERAWQKVNFGRKPTPPEPERA